MKFYNTLFTILFTCLFFACKNAPKQIDSAPPPQEEKDIQAGYFFYMADAAIFYPCRNPGAPISVAMESGYLDLEKKYLRLLDGDPKKVFLKCKCVVKDVPKMEGGGTERALLVQEIIELSKDKKCP